MKLVVITALIAVCGAAKLDRSYLPPPSSKTAGGSPGAIQTPFKNYRGNQGLGGLPKGGYMNEDEDVVVDAAGAGTRAASPDDTGLGAPRETYGSQNSRVGAAAFDSPTDFRKFANVEASPSNNQFAPQNQVSNRPNAEKDRNAAVLKYEAEVGADSYNFEFETDNGISAEENGVVNNGVQAQGGFSYMGDDGQMYVVRYTADERGYQPVGDHLPTPPPIPEAILKSLEQNARDEAAGILDDGSYDANKYNGGSNYNAKPFNRDQSKGTGNFNIKDTDASGSIIQSSAQPFTDGNEDNFNLDESFQPNPSPSSLEPVQTNFKPEQNQFSNQFTNSYMQSANGLSKSQNNYNAQASAAVAINNNNFDITQNQFGNRQPQKNGYLPPKSSRRPIAQSSAEAKGHSNSQSSSFTQSNTDCCSSDSGSHSSLSSDFDNFNAQQPHFDGHSQQQINQNTASNNFAHASTQSQHNHFSQKNNLNQKYNSQSQQTVATNIQPTEPTLSSTLADFEQYNNQPGINTQTKQQYNTYNQMSSQNVQKLNKPNNYGQSNQQSQFSQKPSEILNNQQANPSFSTSANLNQFNTQEFNNNNQYKQKYSQNVALNSNQQVTTIQPTEPSTFQSIDNNKFNRHKPSFSSQSSQQYNQNVASNQNSQTLTNNFQRPNPQENSGQFNQKPIKAVNTESIEQTNQKYSASASASFGQRNPSAANYQGYQNYNSYQASQNTNPQQKPDQKFSQINGYQQNNFESQYSQTTEKSAQNNYGNNNFVSQQEIRKNGYYYNQPSVSFQPTTFSPIANNNYEQNLNQANTQFSAQNPTNYPEPPTFTPNAEISEVPHFPQSQFNGVTQATASPFPSSTRRPSVSQNPVSQFSQNFQQNTFQSSQQQSFSGQPLKPLKPQSSRFPQPSIDSSTTQNFESTEQVTQNYEDNTSSTEVPNTYEGELYQYNKPAPTDTTSQDTASESSDESAQVDISQEGESNQFVKPTPFIDSTTSNNDQYNYQPNPQFVQQNSANQFAQASAETSRFPGGQGENFSGPRKPPSYDDETGYHY